MQKEIKKIISYIDQDCQCIAFDNRVLDFDYSCDCRHMVHVDGHGIMRIYDLISFEQIGDDCLAYDIHTAKYSADGQFIVSGDGSELAKGENSVCVWDALGQKLAKSEGYKNPIIQVAFSPDGNDVAFLSHDSILRIWNWRMDKTLSFVHYQSSECMSYSPDGKHLVSAGLNIQLWNTLTGQLIRKIEGDLGIIRDINYIMGGKLFSSYQILDGLIRLWNSGTYTLVKQIKVKGIIISLAYSPNSQLIMVNTTLKPRLIDRKSGRQIRVFNFKENYHISKVLFSPDGKSVSFNRGPGLKILKLESWQGIK